MDDIFIEQQPREVTCVCRTAGCENEGIEIAVTVWGDGAPNIYCGPCSTKVDEITPKLGSEEGTTHGAE